MNKKRTSNQGFTLIEFISVITAACVTMSLLAPQYIKYLDKSHETVCSFNRKQVMLSYEISKIDRLIEGYELSLEEFLNNCSDYTSFSSDEICPLGGEISVSEDGNSLVCSCHGKNEVSINPEECKRDIEAIMQTADSQIP